MKPYPRILNDDIKDLANVLRYIARERDADINDWNNLSQAFVAGRKVGKVPTSSADVADTDRVGDFNFSASYLYLCVNNGGAAAWRRVALGSW